MRTFALITLLAACAIAAPLGAIDRRQLAGDSVNGPTAIDHASVNNGASDEGVVKDETSLDGAVINDAVGNTILKDTTNVDLHDNIFNNLVANVVNGADGPTVVGNGNEVLPVVAHGSNGIRLKRQVPGPSVNAPSAVDNAQLNSGVSTEGSLAAGVSADGAQVVNPVGNSLTELNSNTDISGNNLENPNWNQISNVDGPAVAGNDNKVLIVDNQPDTIHFDNSGLWALLGGSPVGLGGI
ncbi:hypothetical protein GQ54DRAFT_126798 [Martensiomyces pterosporus]|nr:hypothetical protein GQ54DRAFT_126798 [Martensiomyces pterosporus]